MTDFKRSPARMVAWFDDAHVIELSYGQYWCSEHHFSPCDHSNTVRETLRLDTERLWGQLKALGI